MKSLRSATPNTAAPEKDAQPQTYAFGPFRLVPGERILRRGVQALPLPPKAFETLLLLVRNPGHLMRKDDLIAALWPDTFVEEVSLASKISILRKVLADAGVPGEYIETVPKQGYRFLPAVTRTWASAPPAPAVEAPAVKAIRFLARPFPIANGDEQIAFLGHSLPEAISGALTGVRSLTVLSSALANDADIDMLLVGRILCDGPQLRVSAELVQVSTGALVGSYVCQAGRDRIFDLQDSLVRRIVELLVPQLTEREHRMLTHDVPASARAYEFYLRATHLESRRTFENICMARDLYRECLDEDPDYAPAWARLGRCYRFLEKFDPEPLRNSELTQWAFRRAFALNPELPLAHNHFTPAEADAGHAQDAMVRLLGQAEKHPNDPQLFSGLVQATRYCGLLKESLRAHQRARRLDPHIVTSVAHTFFLMGDYERTLDSYPPGSRFYLDAAVMAVTGREGEALSLLDDRSLLAPLVRSLRCSLQGDHAQSIEMAKQALESKPPPDPEMRFYLARHMARGGAEADALQTIEELAAQGFFCSTALQRDPWLRPLSLLPGFPDVLDSVLRREAEAIEAFEAAGGQRVLL